MPRTIDDVRTRWTETLKHTGDLAQLQRAVRYNGPASPCVAGCRSLCWKIFLLFRDTSSSNWGPTLAEARTEYDQWCERHLKFTRHPEELANVAIDPLADDPDSPWNTLRQDEVIRAEIAQDVQRLPDEPLYQLPETQTLITDVLFIYCKLNPKDGGYRQGMHELLAPIVHVLHQDACEQSNMGTDAGEDPTMLEVLDPAYIEHDAFALFSQIMQRAKAFYEVKDSNTTTPAPAAASRDQAETSAIVEKSKFIHENYLARVDPQLARHLKDVEVLPQIFLIRWIRLLLGREFPFAQLLVLWDALFAVDPSLDLIDLICVAMLVRIRWRLLEADYSHCLQLLLKYPAPDEHHGPHTFVDDAVYLGAHLDASGGASLILKYTGKPPSSAPSSASSSRPRTPSFRDQISQQRLRLSRSPLSSPTRFVQQQGGMEAIFQGAAKNVLERGEKLGINQAVRDAMGEIKRNVQTLNDVRHAPRATRQVLADDSATRAIAALEKRNKLLAAMLDESILNLKALATSDFEDRVKMLELVEMAAAKVQFVKVHLEDSTIDVPGTGDNTPVETEKTGIATEGDSEVRQETIGDESGTVDATEAVSTLKIDLEGRHVPESPDAPEVVATSATPPDSAADMLDISVDKEPGNGDGDGDSKTNQTDGPHDSATATVTSQRPAPIPTRSTLAQSSFSWMLEPDESVPHSPPSSKAQSPAPAQGSTNLGHRSKRSGNASRDRNAFLFGEATAESDGADPAGAASDIFGMELISRKQKDGGKGLW